MPLEIDKLTEAVDHIHSAIEALHESRAQTFLLQGTQHSVEELIYGLGFPLEVIEDSTWIKNDRGTRITL